MKYLSTRNNNLRESFIKILFQGLSKEGGLFLPTVWPLISLKDLYDKTYEEVAYILIRPYLQNEVSDDQLKSVLDKTYKIFNHKNIAPLINLDKNKYILELFHGPTLAFKDYALQFLGNLFDSILENEERKITILGATSGDTGSAAIEAFKGKSNIEVFILHPHEKVSEFQRLQMTTTSENNIHNIAVKGTFDDCQKIVKELFMDRELQSNTSLIAINSINWARLIAQVVYYFWAYIQLRQNKVSFVVPSGNFGNIFSARVAKYMGLPIEELHIVTNANDILHKSIQNGHMKIKTVKQTYSPSMDIQISSNFERQLFESSNRDSDLINKIMSSFAKNREEKLPISIVQNMQSNFTTHSVDNSETLKSIKNIKNKYNYLSDPHTATGLYVLDKLNNDHSVIALACAHPAKFSSAIYEAINEKPLTPPNLQKIFDLKERMTILENDSQKIKSQIFNFI